MSTENRLRNLIGNAGMESRASEAEWDAFARKAHGALFTRRAAAALGTVALIGVIVFAAITLRPTSDDQSIAPVGTPTPGVEETPVPQSTASAQEQYMVPDSEQELWFVNGEKLFWGTTVRGGPVATNLAGDDPVEQAAAFWLEVLLRGPQGPDLEAGATTTIPEGTELLGVRRGDATLFVDLSSEFESGGGSLSMQMRVAQVVYTATQFEGIDAVRIMIEGEMVDSIGGEGVMVERPLTRRDFEGFAPNIVLEEPRPGQEFSPGDLISGFANVFEANVSIVLTFGDGKGPEGKIETFTTATCGTGCWGDFDHLMEFDLQEPTEGRLTVLTYSAEDGSEQDVISIPVMLVP